MSALLPFEQQLAARWPAQRWRAVGLLVAVSGGPDSVALLRGLARLREDGPGRLVVAHFNHRLRGALATADQQFVVDLCRSLTVECVVGQAASDALPTSGEGLEGALRAARYEFLVQAAEQIGARYIATGHTADDQAETILHHILRGTGLTGLAGMRRARAVSPAVTIARPMLAITRTDVLAYLTALGQSYQQDATNCDRSLMRNRIRHELLPLLAREYAPSVVDSLLRLGALAGDAQRVIETLAESLFEQCLLEGNAGRVVFDCGPLRAADRHLVREVFVAAWRRQSWPQQSMGWAQWNLLADMATSDESSLVATQVLPGAITAQRTGEQLSLAASR